MYKILLLAALLLIFNCSCGNKSYSKTIKISDAFFKGEVSVGKIEKLNKFKLTIFNSTTQTSDHIYTPYEIFNMETGDVNHDGKTDICIGIIKPTPFDSVLKKRLFIFQIDHDYIRPLWLSSRLVNPMEEFSIGENKGEQTIITLERKNINYYCINEYRWESFGMAYLKEHKDSLHYVKAHYFFNKFK